MTRSLSYTPRHRAGFTIASLGSGLMMASASAPSPFYPVLQRQMAFSDATMTAIFAVYAIVLLFTLLTGGSSSDHLGRRPVLSFAFLVLAVAALAFELATSPAGLIGARALQGIACAFLLSTLSAAIVDLEPPDKPGMAAVCNTTIPLIGLAAGALASGLVMEHAAYPKADVFIAITAISLMLSGVVWLLPETSPRHEGLLDALKPRLGVPAPARSAFWQSAPAIFAGWATGGLYLSLGAPIVAVVFGIGSFLMQAAVVTLLAGMGALACFLARGYTPRQIMLYGTTALALGTTLTLVGVAIGSLGLYLLALAFAGTGFGTCFYASLRTIVPLTPPDERGELFASIFTLSYLAFGLPVVFAGLVIPHIGLEATVLGYGMIIAVMAAVAGLWRRFGVRS
ncbi:MFS transporter [Rhizobium nepotum]|uniref:MFS transporter n=1 Tax=Rhizobium nepotum TaxID=1035271 RepID=UPI00336ADE53